ncbi:MAG: hypothetical protein J6334_08935 [Kiritimatiellae bacterium]|nr:hypothetical protein [Kiritimatiellia bacterium]
MNDVTGYQSCYAAARRHVLHNLPHPPHYPDIWRALEKGEKPAEIAKRTGVTPATVRQVKHRLSAQIAALVQAMACD